MNSGENSGIDVNCLGHPEYLLPPGKASRIQNGTTTAANAIRVYDPARKSCVDDLWYVVAAFTLAAPLAPMIISAYIIQCIGDRAKFPNHETYLQHLQSALQREGEHTQTEIISAFIAGLTERINENPSAIRENGTLKDAFFQALAKQAEEDSNQASAYEP